MSTLQITTNNRPIPLLSGYELTEKEWEGLDYIDPKDREDCTDRFFRYRGQLYDTHEFVRIESRKNYRGGFGHCVDDDSPLLKWDAIQTDSFFSAIVYRHPVDECNPKGRDWGYVVVGTVTC